MSHDSHHEEARLSRYLDGELQGRDAEAVRAHLARCRSCRSVLDGLAEVRRRAGALEDRAPVRDLWPAIREALAGPRVIDLTDRLERKRRRRRRAERAPGGVVLSWPQLGAAAAALVVLAAGGAWGVVRAVGPAPGTLDAGPGAVEAAPPGMFAAGAGGALAASDRLERVAPELEDQAAAVAELQDALDRGRDRLRPGTVHVLDKNLALIDAAIRESLDALAEDPGNPFVERHLRRSFERKVTYLREAAALLEGAD